MSNDEGSDERQNAKGTESSKDKMRITPFRHPAFNLGPSFVIWLSTLVISAIVIIPGETCHPCLTPWLERDKLSRIMDWFC